MNETLPVQGTRPLALARLTFLYRPRRTCTDLPSSPSVKRPLPTNPGNRKVRLAAGHSLGRPSLEYLGELGAEVKVVRNDELTVAQIAALNPERIVVSPGPCTPTEAGISLEAIQYFAGKLPILGVCLGHQSIGQAFGGDVVRARQVMHGKTSPVFHKDQGVFQGLNLPVTVTRYHSLVVKRETLPECLELTAWTQLEDGSVDEIMGLRLRAVR
eukprot:gene7073-8228_t